MQPPACFLFCLFGLGRCTIWQCSDAWSGHKQRVLMWARAGSSRTWTWCGTSNACSCGRAQVQAERGPGAALQREAARENPAAPAQRALGPTARAAGTAAQDRSGPESAAEASLASMVRDLRRRIYKRSSCVMDRDRAQGHAAVSVACELWRGIVDQVKAHLHLERHVERLCG